MDIHKFWEHRNVTGNMLDDPKKVPKCSNCYLRRKTDRTSEWYSIPELMEYSRHFLRISSGPRQFDMLFSIRKDRNDFPTGSLYDAIIFPFIYTGSNRSIEDNENSIYMKECADRDVLYTVRKRKIRRFQRYLDRCRRRRTEKVIRKTRFTIASGMTETYPTKKIHYLYN